MRPSARFLKSLRNLVGVSVLVGASAAANAQGYPERPIHLVVPFAAGGTVDIVARIVAAELADSAHATVVVDNKGGAGGVIGTEYVAHSPGDGYTLLLHSAAITYDPSLHAHLPYDTMKDLAPVAMIGSTPNLLVVNPSSPARSAADLIEMARRKPNTITYATGGYGSSSHLAVALFSNLSGATFNHVPYKGAGPALADVVAGHIDFTIATMPGAIGQVRGGTLRALGISSLSRSPEQPDVPTIAQTGLPGYEYVAWFGVFAPASTPPALVAQLNRLLQQALRVPETGDKLRQQGVATEFSSPEKFREQVTSEIARWHDVIAKAGIKAEP
jgi:tripartite-type tricarboxylate transporter receptor subunit TctC